MVISYDNLWKLLIDKKMNKTDLKDKAGITYNIIAYFGHIRTLFSKTSGQ